jgi:hypothetical protein
VVKATKVLVVLVAEVEVLVLQVLQRRAVEPHMAVLALQAQLAGQ